MKDLLTNINKEEYVEYRLTHTQKETQEHFSLTRKNVLYLDEELKLDKNKLKKVAEQRRATKFSESWDSLSEEEKQKRNKENSERLKRYYKNHPEAKNNISEKQKEYYSNEQHRQKQSSVMKEYFKNNPQSIEKMKESLVEYYKDNPEARQERSNSIKAYYEIEENRQEQSKRLKAYHRNNPHAHKNQIQTQRTFWDSEQGAEVKKHLSDKAKERWATDTDYRNAVIEGHSDYWGSEEFKKLCSENGKKVWDITEEERRKRFNKFSKGESAPNKNFAKLLDDNNISYEREFYVDHFLYDFRVGNNLIEINPYPFHNITFSPFGEPRDKDYHYQKSLVAKNNDYRCIHVWDWDNIDKVIELLKPREKVYARKCTVQEVDKDIACKFINSYHLQGSTKTDRSKNTIRLGLYYNNELVSIMTFGKPRYNKKYEYELIRFCSSYAVIGGAEKLFKYFLRKYKPSSIISYCDFSKFSGNTYEKLGFSKLSLGISSHWYNPKTKRHITDNLLRRYGADKLLDTNYGKGTDNKEILVENGFVEIRDSGQITYVYAK